MSSNETTTRNADTEQVISRAFAASIADINRRLSILERANLDAAARLDQMANDLGYPLSSVHGTKKHLREVATILRAGVRR